MSDDETTRSVKTTTKHGCPVFFRKKEEYEEWKVRAEDWLWVTRKEVEGPGVEIRMALRGRALDVVKDMDRNVLKQKGGDIKIFEKLDSVYKKDQLLDKYSKMKAYLKIERKENEKMDEYIIRYEKCADECNMAIGAGGNMITGQLKGCHVMDQARLTDEQKQMVLAACGGDDLDYNKMRKALLRIFQSLEVEGKEKESEWWEKGREEFSYNNRGRNRDFQGYQGRKNPRGKYGQITKCAICYSEYHWARDCPKNFQNRNKGSLEKGDSNVVEKRVMEKKEGERKETGNAEKSYMLTEDENTHSWGEVEAILDTGCKSTICGDI